MFTISYSNDKYYIVYIRSGYIGIMIENKNAIRYE